MSGTPKAAQSWFETVIDESLRAFTTVEVAAEVRAEALQAMGSSRLPEDGTVLETFLRGPLAAAMQARLGREVSDAIVEHLGPLAAAARTGTVARGELGSTSDAEDESTAVRSPLARLAPARWIVLVTRDRAVVKAVERQVGSRGQVDCVLTTSRLMVTLAAAKRRDSGVVLFLDGMDAPLRGEEVASAAQHLPVRTQIVVRAGPVDFALALDPLRAAGVPCVVMESHSSPALIASACAALLTPSRSG